MIDINLLPRPRRHANDRRRALRRWVLWGTLWGSALAAGQGIAVTSGAVTDLAPLERELSRLGEERDRLDGEIAGLRQSLDRGTKSLAAARAVVDHPDWSALLARVVTARPDGVVFRRWSLARGPNGSLLLRMEGDVAALAGLTEFALRLEGLRVFRGVTIVTAQAAERNERGEVDRTIRFVIEAGLIAPTPPSASTPGAAPS